MERICLLGAAVLLAAIASGCINKGPYYIYGDYIESSGEEELLEEAGEQPPAPLPEKK
jgi:hypothetical protein